MTRGGDDIPGHIPDQLQDRFQDRFQGQPQGRPQGHEAPEEVSWAPSFEGGAESSGTGRHGRGARRRPYARPEPADARPQTPPRRSWSRQKGYIGHTGHLGAHASGEPYEDEEADDEAVLTAPAPEPESGPESGYEDLEPEPEAPRRGWAGGLLVAFLAIAVAGLAVAVTLAYLDLRTLRQNEADGAAALAAARAYAPDMLAYDHRHIEQDLARARGHATARLAEYYRQLAATLIPQARREQTVQQVTIAGAAVESASPDRVRVLMLVNRTTSKLPPGHKSRKGEVNQGRVRFVMVKRGDGVWLVDDLSTLLGNPPART